MSVWSLLKDILLTGTGLALILSQMLSHDPNTALLVAGLTLTTPTLADHAKAVLSGSPSGSDSGKHSATDGESESAASSPSPGSQSG